MCDLVACVRGKTVFTHSWIVTRCGRKAPEEPNVFTDGSLTTPACAYGGVATAAVDWPGRALPLSEEAGMMADR
eukprot:1005129-Alexandrium_andersonii.AAC.1